MDELQNIQASDNLLTKIFGKQGNGKQSKRKESKVGANSNQLIWLCRLVQSIMISQLERLTKWKTTKINYGHKIGT